MGGGAPGSSDLLRSSSPRGRLGKHGPGRTLAPRPGAPLVVLAERQGAGDRASPNRSRCPSSSWPTLVRIVRTRNIRTVTAVPDAWSAGNLKRSARRGALGALDACIAPTRANALTAW